MLKQTLDLYLKFGAPIALLLVIVVVALTYVLTDTVRSGVGYSPNQPIPYSHELHAGKLNIDCRYCHVGADQGRHAVIPSAEICMKCHTYAKTDSPHIKKLKEYYDSGEPIAWKRVHKLPDHVYFDHSAHVNSNITCQTCHGEIQEMEKVRQVRKFDMGSCLECHRTAHDELKDATIDGPGPEHCSACHR